MVIELLIFVLLSSLWVIIPLGLGLLFTKLCKIPAGYLESYFYGMAIILIVLVVIGALYINWYLVGVWL